MDEPSPGPASCTQENVYLNPQIEKSDVSLPNGRRLGGAGGHGGGWRAWVCGAWVQTLNADSVSFKGKREWATEA